MVTSFGSMVFCDKCGTLLDVPGNEDELKCDGCDHRYSAKVYESIVVTTKSRANAFPSALRQKRNLVVDDSGGEAKQATIKETCPNCKNDEMHFTTLQLRSADEGTTVFFTCPKCGYKYSTNN